MPYFQYTDYARYDAGLAILSQKPLDNVKIHYFSTSRHGYGALAAEIRITDQKLLLCSLHLDRIPQVMSHRWVSGFTTLRVFKNEIFNETVRSRSVEEVLDWLSGFYSNHIIIGGDFNTFPFSKPIRKMAEKYNDALWPTMSYFTGTYNELDYPFTPLNPRIDFLFHSPAIKRLRAEVVKTGPSDHYPVKAVFGLESGKIEG
jgi:endonuclease/exonuclease/phosphatase family metal-dependent hydrolase